MNQFIFSYIARSKHAEKKLIRKINKKLIVENLGLGAPEKLINYPGEKYELYCIKE